MDEWIVLVLIALAIAIFLQIDWAMYLLLVLLVGLAILVQKSEIKPEIVEEVKPTEKKEKKVPQQIIVTQPATGSYLDLVYGNLITEALLRGKRGLTAWARKEPPYSTLQTGLGDIRYVENEILTEVKGLKEIMKKLVEKKGD